MKAKRMKIFGGGIRKKFCGDRWKVDDEIVNLEKKYR